MLGKPGYGTEPIEQLAETAASVLGWLLLLDKLENFVSEYYYAMKSPRGKYVWAFYVVKRNLLGTL